MLVRSVVAHKRLSGGEEDHTVKQEINLHFSWVIGIFNIVINPNKIPLGAIFRDAKAGTTGNPYPSKELSTSSKLFGMVWEKNVSKKL